MAFSLSDHEAVKDRAMIISFCASSTQSQSSRKLVEGKEWRAVLSLSMVNNGISFSLNGPGLCGGARGIRLGCSAGKRAGIQ